MLVFIAVVGLGDWNLQFDWRPTHHADRTFNEPFQSGGQCVARATSLITQLMKTLPQGSTDYRYEWHCLPHGMVF